MLPSHHVATHPGQILLQEFLEPLNLTQAELARALTIPLNRVNELVRGKRGITPETALLLAGYFKNSAEFWMKFADSVRSHASSPGDAPPSRGGRSERRSAGAD
jgi:addiction module HigA family antidote